MSPAARRLAFPLAFCLLGAVLLAGSAYLTFAPRVGVTDAERKCVSNIHGAGLSYDEAAYKIGWLIRQGLARQLTGVALKDESGDRTPQRIA